MMEAVSAYEEQFETVKIAEPLLGDVGTDATVINADKEAVAKALTAEAVKEEQQHPLAGCINMHNHYLLLNNDTSGPFPQSTLW